MGLWTHKRGFSLIEAAIVLAIVGLVLGGVWVAASIVSTNMKINEFAEGVLYTCNKAARVFPGRVAQPGTSLDGIGDEIIRAKAAPANWVPDQWTLRASLGTHFYIHQIQRDAAYYPGSIMMDIGGIPVGYCRKIASLLAPAMKQNGTIVYLGFFDTGSNGPGVEAPFMGVLGDNCQTASDPNPTTRYWIYCAPGM